MKKALSIILALIVFYISGNAQDKIVRKNGTTIICKITEIGTNEIKYFPIDNLTGPVHSLSKDKIKKIVYENGKEETFTINWKDSEIYSEQMKKAVKINFLSPLFGYTYVTYERSKGVGKSYELGLGVIGLGRTNVIGYYDANFASIKKQQFGAYVSAGYKFNKLPDFIFGSGRMSHLMQGAYVKPTLYLGNYSENRMVYKASASVVKERQNVTFGALMLEIGKQWVFGDKLVMDIYFGFGYDGDNKKSVQDYSYGNTYYYENETANNYIVNRVSKSPGFAMTSGLRIGLLTK